MARGFFALGLTATIATATCLLVSGARAATKEKVIYSFTAGSDGGEPSSPLISDRAGNLYGEASLGSVVFELEPCSNGDWMESTFYAFRNQGAPTGGLVLSDSGAFYGVTYDGYFNSPGTVFDLPPVSLSNPVIYSFASGGPEAGLVLDQAGVLYGTTEAGGDNGGGSVFELTPNGGGWSYEVIHSFATTTGTDGAYPFGRLVKDAAGNLYGTTYQGGVYGGGTVFELTKTSSGWTESVLYNFTGGDNGYSPFAGVIFDANGNLYGTTYQGGVYEVGTVFQLTPSHGYWNYRVIYSFTGGLDGGNPYYGSLAIDTAGRLYGTTRYGGRLQYGTVFQLAQGHPGKWKETVVHSFNGGRDGKNPVYGVVLDSAGNLYGTTPSGGADGWGIVFECVP
jgi:uncharacterized repeat protein (TIGR03803 family)